MMLRMTFREYAGTISTQGGLLALGVVTGVLSARLLGPAGRGELAAVTIWPLALVFLSSLGINQAIVYYTGKRAYSVSQIHTASLTVGIAQAIAVLAIGSILLPFSLRQYSSSVRMVGFLLLASTPALILSGYPASIFQGQGRPGLFNLIRTSASAFYCVGLVTLYLVHRTSLFTVVTVQAAGYLFAALLGYSILFAKLRPHINWNPVVARQLGKFGVRAQAANISNYFNQRIDQLIMALFVRPAELGLYVVAVTLATAVTFFSQASGIVTLTRASSAQGHGAARVISTSFRITLLWLALSCALLFMLAPWLINTVFGARFAGSILACRILLPGMVALGLNQVLYNGACALGKPLLSAYAEGCGMVITAVGLAIVLPRWGYIGAAAVSTTSYTVTLLVMLFLLRTKAHLTLRTLFGGLGGEESTEVEWQKLGWEPTRRSSADEMGTDANKSPVSM